MKALGVEARTVVSDHRGIQWAICPTEDCGWEPWIGEPRFEGDAPRLCLLMLDGDEPTECFPFVREVQRHGDVTVLLSWDHEDPHEARVFAATMEVPSGPWATKIREERANRDAERGDTHSAEATP